MRVCGETERGVRAWDGNSGAAAVLEGAQLAERLLQEREALF